MFGLTTFSQSPFVALGKNIYSFSVTENFTLADSSTQVYAFLQSISENATLADSSTQVFNALFTLAENSTIADNNTQIFKIGRAHV